MSYCGYPNWNDRCELSVLLGKTLNKVYEDYEDNNGLVFEVLDDGASYLLSHIQDCCESVYIEDICGDLDDLVGSPILLAEEVSNRKDPGPKSEYDESYTWTFYKFSTIKGSVTVRFYGTSNGYYSEGVSFFRI